MTETVIIISILVATPIVAIALGIASFLLAYRLDQQMYYDNSHDI